MTLGLLSGLSGPSSLRTESSMEQFRFDGDSGSLGVSVGGRSSWEWGTGEAAHW